MTRYKQYLLGSYLHGFSLPFLCTVFSSNAQSGQTTVQVTGVQATSVQACSISSHFYLLAKAPTHPAQAGVGWTGTRNQSRRKSYVFQRKNFGA